MPPIFRRLRLGPHDQVERNKKMKTLSLHPLYKPISDQIRSSPLLGPRPPRGSGRTVIAIGLVSALLVLPAVHGQGTFQLLYSLQYTGPAYPGESIFLISNFTNGGTLPERVTGVSISTDFGTFNASSGLPLYLAAGQKVELKMIAQIPSATSVGTSAVTAFIYFQYNYTSQWITPRESPLVFQRTISIVSNPLQQAAAIGYAILGLIAALFVVVFLFVRMRPKAEAIPPS